jgi:peptide deformylase
LIVVYIPDQCAQGKEESLSVPDRDAVTRRKSKVLLLGVDYSTTKDKAFRNFGHPHYLAPIFFWAGKI